MGLLMKIKIPLGLLKLLKLLIFSRVSGQVRLELRDSAEFGATNCQGCNIVSILFSKGAMAAGERGFWSRVL